MKNFTNPEVEIIELEVCDVITTSPEPPATEDDQLPYG